MYKVVVILKREYQREVVVDSKSFPYGEWMEIAHWVDNNGYSDPKYKLEVEYTK